jgi:hypothetical protein
LTYNLLFWRWSDEYATPSKRKKIRFEDITRGFSEWGSHPAMGVADITGFRSAIDDAFGANEDARPFVFEEHSNCVVINYPNAVRFELVPKLASIGKRFGLNASEF